MLAPVPDEDQGPDGAPVGFRNRGGDISRVEGFSDCAFGFAVTLLVVSLEVPRTFDGLLEVMRGIPAFAVSFAVLGWIWFTHYRFFRRYGLEDVRTVMLTLLLLFVVLCYVYPLKFLYSATLGTGGGGITPDQVRLLFVIYGAGLAAVFTVLALLHVNAYAQRDRLGLDGLERAETRVAVGEMLGVVAVSLLSCALALLPLGLPSWLAGFAYFLNAVVFSIGGRRRRAIRRRAGAA
jgi:uncharacterized membrane protein